LARAPAVRKGSAELRVLAEVRAKVKALLML